MFIKKAFKLVLHSDWTLSLSAPSCFLVPDPSKEEAAVSVWRPMMHSEGDHMTLINVYNAFIERTSSPLWFQDEFLTVSAS